MNPWREVERPSAGPAESIGNYSAGCLKGAEYLEMNDVGIAVMRPSRRRYFGHPALIALIKSLGKFSHSHGYGKLLIGDLAQARGGPTMSQHQSHQTGLDADIWLKFWPDKKRITENDRESFQAASTVDWEKRRLNKNWNPHFVKLIKKAAEDYRVERILINPLIKRHLCRIQRKERDWLRKLRPWWGHADHIHIRLACPENSSFCTKQAALNEKLGCGKELDWWFGEEARREYTEVLKKMANPVMPILPDQCSSLLKSP